MDLTNKTELGFVQQTFLGASIQNFDISAGFGTNTSSLTVNLVNDEFNKSDGTGTGTGDDPYHNGKFDFFSPPVVGSPVYFKFGKSFSTIQEAFRRKFDNLYNEKTAANYTNHFVFGGILQSYTENKGQSARPSYSVNIVDPREILSNIELILNNYQGSTYNNKNIYNIYGFLEFDPSSDFLTKVPTNAIKTGIVKKKVSNANNAVEFLGINSRYNLSKNRWENLTDDSADIIYKSKTKNLKDEMYFTSNTSSDSYPSFFPVTGQGFSRRSEKGMPWYRIIQGINGIFDAFRFNNLKEYAEAGFGGAINFRGYNYLVDFGSLPIDKIPLSYYLDFDKIDMLSLIQEICDITSHDFFVSLLPVINHPACEDIYKYNNRQIMDNKEQDIIAGIIRIDAIDRTKQPEYGAIKSYINELNDRGTPIENQDVGFELSNVVTDRFVVGAQEVDMYYFHNERDRDTLWTQNKENNPDKIQQLQKSQWQLSTQLQQQIIPFYGFIGNKAVSIPRGFGPYKQILLDARGLNAYGVGKYYVATEMELRAALISYERWRDFLLSYNDVYVEDVSDHRIDTSLFGINTVHQSLIEKLKNNLPSGSGVSTPAAITQAIESLSNADYRVTVPRSVWDSFISKKNIVPVGQSLEIDEYGDPRSPCNPPFGYPLYYHRATNIGILQAGLARVVNAKTRIMQNLDRVTNKYSNSEAPITDDYIDNLQKAKGQIESELARLKKQVQNPQISERIKMLEESGSEMSQMIEYYSQLIKNINGAEKVIQELNKDDSSKFLVNLDRNAKRSEDNAKKVYDFVKSIADQCLGKKFLVRIPKKCNTFYSKTIFNWNPQKSFNKQAGPFGFAPRAISNNLNIFGENKFFDIQNIQFMSKDFAEKINKINNDIKSNDTFLSYLDESKSIFNSYNVGALKGNFNPFNERWEWNYKPENQGGFYSYDIIGYDYSINRRSNLNRPIGMVQQLIPVDLKNLLSDDNRIKCYVRYDHSEMLDLSSISRDQMTQQFTENNVFIPDVSEQLPNIEQSSNTILEKTEDQNLLERQPDSVAFIQCEVDENFYMPPEVIDGIGAKVYGSNYDIRLSMPQINYQSVDDCDNPSVVIKHVIDPIFTIPKDGGKGVSQQWDTFKWNDVEDEIETRPDLLGSNYVYALITLPGRISSSLRTRWNDGVKDLENTTALSHLMLQDVVIGVFDETVGTPPVIKGLKKEPPCVERFSLEDPQASIKAADNAKKLGLAGSHIFNGYYYPGADQKELSQFLRPSLADISRISAEAKLIKKSVASQLTQLSIVAPSPVYPDLVAIPMMSMERCYGPWLSSTKLSESFPARYSDIGGKIEFDKDENLSPWNYGGYYLLNEAGNLKASLSNSLLLFNERGGFVYPDAPVGIDIATALKEAGPLITSISVNISEAGVKTTVKMDLYTSQFGKLSRQKEIAIDKIVREKQKSLDQKNNAIRRGFGKLQTSENLFRKISGKEGEKIIDLNSNLNNLESLTPVENIVITSSEDNANINLSNIFIAGKLE